MKKLSQFLLFRLMGWKTDISIEMPEKCVICLAPHTSNWDFLLGQLYQWTKGVKINFLMKKEWFVGPLKHIFRGVGGIPVSRGKHTHLTDQLAEEALKSDTFRLCVTPEGTRSLNPDWKKGFYFIALKADIPILLYALDYQQKLIRCTKSIKPTGDIDNEMREIKRYYKDVKGKRPELFTTGEI